MSKQQVTKQVDTVVCDYCGEDMEDVGSANSVHIVRDLMLEQPTGKEKWLKFIWYDPRPKMNRNVRYDFHGACFDELVKTSLPTTTTGGDAE